MKKILSVIFICTLFAACKPDKKAMLEKTWRASTVNNPQTDTMLMQGQIFIDTVGKSTDAESNMELYGTINMDSLKKGLQLQMDSLKTLQLNTVQNTVFTFRKDGVAIISFNGSLDSSKWYLNDDGALILDEMKEKGSGDKIKMDIVSLTDTALQLKFQENGSSSMVTFHPDKN